MYSNSYCNCSFETEIINIDPSSHKIYSTNILNFQECTTILNSCTRKSGNLLKAPRTKPKREMDEGLDPVIPHERPP